MLRPQPQPLDSKSMSIPSQPFAAHVVATPTPRPVVAPLTFKRTHSVNGMAMPHGRALSPPVQLSGWQKARAVRAVMSFCHNPALPMAPYPPGFTPSHGQISHVVRAMPATATPSATFASIGSRSTSASFGYTPQGVATRIGFGELSTASALSRRASKELSIPSVAEGVHERVDDNLVVDATGGSSAAPVSGQSVEPNIAPNDLDSGPELVSDGVTFSREMLLFYKESPSCHGVGLTAEEAGFVLPQAGWIRMEEDGELPPAARESAIAAAQPSVSKSHGGAHVTINGVAVDNTKINKKSAHQSAQQGARPLAPQNAKQQKLPKQSSQQHPKGAQQSAPRVAYWQQRQPQPKASWAGQQQQQWSYQVTQSWPLPQKGYGKGGSWS